MIRRVAFAGSFCPRESLPRQMFNFSRWCSQMGGGEAGEACSGLKSSSLGAGPIFPLPEVLSSEDRQLYMSSLLDLGFEFDADPDQAEFAAFIEASLGQPLA